jgi:DNA-binding MarR family transcriptional regulator
LITVQNLREVLLLRNSGKEALTQGADHRTLREYNHLLILNCVRQQGPSARVAIAQQTGLSKTTVSSIIDQLLQDGLVTEGNFLDASSS